MEKKTTKKVATKAASKQKTSKTIKYDYVLAPESTPFVTNYDAKLSLLQRIKKFLGL
jgi:hypothetical protein